MSRRYEARFEKIDSSDELCVCHIDDIWNSQTYIPDRNYPNYPIVLWTTGEALGEIYIDYDSSDYNNSLLRLKW